MIELGEQFGVSRAVVRDATRILMAQGLVEVKHGLGVFVTPPQNEAFGEALLLALRRAGVTVWEVEQCKNISSRRKSEKVHFFTPPVETYIFTNPR